MKTEADKVQFRARRRAYYQQNKDVFKRGARKWEAKNRLRINACRKQYLHAHPVKAMLISARARAKEKGVPFDLTDADVYIPTHCPVLGIPLKRGDKWAAPSLDRRVPKLGYVRGNVEVMSNRANLLKSNATPEEIHALSDYLKIRALVGAI